MKVAIHHQERSFSDRWIAYCEEKNIAYKVVNAFDSNIIDQVKQCDVFMWHHHHANFNDVIVAKKVLFALEHSGVKVFPDFKTGWHFDDKVAQKYLLEGSDAPLVPSYVFYDKNEALAWAKDTVYPKVFKLKGGAGSANVMLVKNFKSAGVLINKAFGKGFPQFDKLQNLKDKIARWRSGQGSVINVAKAFARLFISTDFSKKQSNEKGYAYFQDFIAGNDSDTRVVVIYGKYAAAEKRMVRSGDFRASGSGVFSYEGVNINFVDIAFKVANKLKLQSVAFDFIETLEGEPLIVEMSYGFGTAGILKAPGYWDENLNWYEASFIPEEWMVKGLLNLG